MDRYKPLETVISNEYENNLEYLQAELKRIELILFAATKRGNPYKCNIEGVIIPGLNFPSTDVDSVLSSVFGDIADISDINTINQSLQELESKINLKKLESDRSGLNLRLYKLQNIFNLSSFEIDVILMCLLPELNFRFEKYYAYLQDDITKRSATIGLILKFLCENHEDALQAKHVFSPEAPLIKNNLIHVYNDTGRDPLSAGAKSVQIEERILDYVTGIDHIGGELKSFTQLYSPSITLQDLILEGDLKERLIKFAARNVSSAPVYNFYGMTGTGKRTTAEAICNELGTPILYVDLHHVPTDNMPFKHTLALICREGLLQNAAIYFNEVDSLLSRNNSDITDTIFDTLIHGLEPYPHLTFLASEKRLNFKHNSTRKKLMTIKFAIPEFSTRKELWQRQFKHRLSLAKDVDLSSIADKFRFSSGQIAGAASIAESLAEWSNPEGGLITSSDLYLACRQQSRQKLMSLTHKVESQYNWDDLILPRDQKEQLVEVCSHVRYRQTVYNDWGFSRKISRSKGLNILFSGPSGTGKTMAAGIIGNKLGLDVYKVDLSTIVSKYIGETEKNLDAVFDEAETANVIIFFDEADSVFGKRSEVRDSHDRYSNIEIAYLLQKIDDYDGIAILATNFRKNIDDAFSRRMNFCVEFPIPDETDRYRIWQRIFPKEAPRSHDIDLIFLARQFPITGGSIKNIALASAFLAAQQGGLITMTNLIMATKREYQKIGKLCTETDFANYFHLVRGDDS